MADYRQGEPPWKGYTSTIKTVIIQNGVTSIGFDAFAYAPLASVTIPDSVTSIGVCAFCDCTRLKSVMIPDSATSIGHHAFGYYIEEGGVNYYKVDGFTIFS